MTIAKKITVEVFVQAPLPTVWECFTHPKHVVAWNNASSDWHTPKAENDLRVGGMFTYRMEAKDGSAGFDFRGTYDTVVSEERYSYTMSDGRKVAVYFAKEGGGVRVTETFDPETENPIDMQRDGWQSILNNFKKYVESK